MPGLVLGEVGGGDLGALAAPYANKENQQMTTMCTVCTDVQGTKPPSTGLSVTLAFQVSGKLLFWATLTQNYTGKEM